MVGKSLGAVSRREDQRAAAIGDEAALEQVERVGDHPRFEHVLHGDRVAEAGARVPRRPLALHHGDHGELLVGQTVGPS